MFRPSEYSSWDWRIEERIRLIPVVVDELPDGGPVALGSPVRGAGWRGEPGGVVAHEAFELRIELAGGKRLAPEAGERFLALRAPAGLAHGDADLLGVDLDDVVGGRHGAAHAQRRDGAGVHYADAGNAPDVGDVAVPGEHEVDVELAQDGHEVAGVAQVVDVAAGAGNGEDVVVDHDDLRPGGPVAQLGVDPGVVLAPDFALVEV